ncbi:TlpA disulfide reductase family protein [uncultured Flavobacterium sp.]|uniref:TlpA disulfide reductase family protein n=1 Tax=uncultured Flavobacterium sp. TaxID=165435 RepID=UPI0030C8AC6B
MKKIAILLVAALSVIACKKEGYEISGVAKGVENGKQVFLEIQNEKGPVTLDTAVVESEKFKFDGKLTEGIELAFVRIESLNNSMPIILENGDINLEINKDTIQKSIIGGTPNNEKFYEYNKSSQEIINRMLKFQEENQAKLVASQQKNDTIVYKQLMDQYGKFQDEMNLHSKDFVTKNPKAFISVLLLENFLLRNYLTPVEIKEMYDKLDVSIRETKSGKNIKTMLEAMSSVEIGSVAPDFSAPSPDGKVISLKESMGKVTLIDFWASWCGPCRQENPNVVAMYKELHDKGLNIIGVSLDKEGDMQKWKDAIAKDGLTWNQISNLKHWKEPIAEQYNVKSIPATFLLDASGKIVAKDLRGEELKAKVKELLGVQ